ncbi:MAG: cytochrome-c peroxidase [Halieaceae bacterium]|jgi:cytochrome c peroxidase|nr:cytochrome-c peroxidase [Halieaceae bacterium]
MRKRNLTLLLPGFLCAFLGLITPGVFAEGDPDYDAPLAPLGPVPEPPDNRITPEKAELGKLLFFDPKLSGDASLGCADCHDPKQGWGFNDPICRGYPGAVHWRNCHTVVNTGYLSKLFWTGSSKSMESQAKSAATGGISGNGERDVMEQRLRQTPYYVKAFKEVFGDQRPILYNAWLAMATFERAMLTQKDSPLDRYLEGDKSALSKKAQQGLKLFQGKANCIECHNGPMLSDEKFYSLGVPRPFEWEEMGMNTITYRFELYAKGVHEKYYRNYKDDPGLYFDTKRPKDTGKFRTQPLRYLKYTAPYMHAGQFYTLEEVIDFYNEGGGSNEFTEKFGNKSPILKPLNLTDDEKEALVVFLEEISGDEIEMAIPEVPLYEAVPDAKGLTQASAKRAGLDIYFSSQGGAAK